MSFAENAAALRAFFGVPDDAPRLAAVEMMNVAMDIAGDGPLPRTPPPQLGPRSEENLGGEVKKKSACSAQL